MAKKKSAKKTKPASNRTQKRLINKAIKQGLGSLTKRERKMK